MKCVITFNNGEELRAAVVTTVDKRMIVRTEDNELVIIDPEDCSVEYTTEENS